VAFSWSGEFLLLCHRSFTTRLCLEIALFHW
jgi:hypothetical protein